MSLSTPQSATSTSEMTPGIRSTRPSERNTLGDGVTNSTKRSLMPDFDTPAKVAKNARRTQHELESMSLMQLASCEAKVRTPNGPPLSRRQVMHGWWPLKGVRWISKSIPLNCGYEPYQIRNHINGILVYLQVCHNMYTIWQAVNMTSNQHQKANLISLTFNFHFNLSELNFTLSRNTKNELLFGN